MTRIKNKIIFSTIENFLFVNFHIYDTRESSDIYQKIGVWHAPNEFLVNILKKSGFEFHRMRQTLQFKINDLAKC